MRDTKELAFKQAIQQSTIYRHENKQLAKAVKYYKNKYEELSKYEWLIKFYKKFNIFN